MIQQISEYTFKESRWIKGRKPFELICDQCGAVGVKEGTFQECVDFAKKWKWQSKSVRTNGYPRFIWSHLCRKCSLGEWKTVNEE